MSLQYLSTIKILGGVGGGGKRRGSEREERKKKEDKPTVIRKDVLTLIHWRLLKRVHNSVV